MILLDTDAFIADSLDGSPAVRTHTLTLDGLSLRLFLSAENSARLIAAVEPFLQAGQSVNQTARPAHAGADSTSVIRAWARAQGFDIGVRGRIPAQVLVAFAARHARSTPTS